MVAVGTHERGGNIWIEVMRKRTLLKGLTDLRRSEGTRAARRFQEKRGKSGGVRRGGARPKKIREAVVIVVRVGIRRKERRIHAVSGSELGFLAEFGGRE